MVQREGIAFIPATGKTDNARLSESSKEKNAIAARILWSSVHGLCFLEVSRKIPFITDHATAEDMRYHDR